jgi:hypothetical protein
MEDASALNAKENIWTYERGSKGRIEGMRI